MKSQKNLYAHNNQFNTRVINVLKQTDTITVHQKHTRKINRKFIVDYVLPKAFNFADSKHIKIQPKSYIKINCKKTTTKNKTKNAWFGFNPHPGHVVVPLNKTLCDQYLYLVVSNKHQI